MYSNRQAQHFYGLLDMAKRRRRKIRCGKRPTYTPPMTMTRHRCCWLRRIGHEQVVELLLDNGVDVNINAHGALYGNALYAASERGYEAVVKMLLDKGTDVNARGGGYSNALQAASSRGHKAVVQLLLSKGADVNARGGEFGNALQAASFRGYSSIVQQQLDNGAEVNAQGGILATCFRQRRTGAMMRW
jgi:ankyrin repeat protein